MQNRNQVCLVFMRLRSFNLRYSYGFKNTSMDSHEDATACYMYELQMPEICYT